MTDVRPIPAPTPGLTTILDHGTRVKQFVDEALGDGAELVKATLAGPTTGQILRYNETTGKFENTGFTFSNADVGAAAGIEESKLVLASDAVAGTASRRSLGHTSIQASPGDHSHLVPEHLAFFSPGEAVETGTHRLYGPGSYVWSIAGVRASLGVAPVGASYIVDIKRNGVSIYSTNTQRPTILTTAYTGFGGARLVETIAESDYVTVDILQVGASPNTGSSLTVQVMLERVVNSIGWVAP